MTEATLAGIVFVLFIVLLGLIVWYGRPTSIIEEEKEVLDEETPQELAKEMLDEPEKTPEELRKEENEYYSHM